MYQPLVESLSWDGLFLYSHFENAGNELPSNITSGTMAGRA
jgi:hypothetical protein